MKRYVWMHKTEAGFSHEGALEWIERRDDKDEYRLVEIKVDPVTEALSIRAQAERDQEMFEHGVEHERSRLRNLLGIERKV